MSYLPANRFDRIEALEGQTIWQVGASWEANDTKNAAGARAITRLFNRSGAATLTNKALSGRISAESAGRTLSTTDTFAAGTKALVICGSGDIMNHMAWNGYSTSLQKSTVLEPIRAMLAAFSAASRIESASMTQSGTWTLLTGQTRSSAGNAHYTTNPGDYAEISVTVNATGKVDVMTYLSDDAGLALRSAAIDVLVDGVLVKTIADPNLYRRVTAAGATDTTYASYSIPLTGLSAGAHTIRIRHGGNGAKAAPTYLYADAFFVRSTTPPPIIVVGPPQMNWSLLTGTYSRTHTNAETVALDADLASMIAAEFPNALFVSLLASAFDITTMMGDDNLHPNDKGMAFIANLLVDAARRVTWQAGLHTQVR